MFKRKKNQKIGYQKFVLKKSCGKIENFHQQVKQGPYYTCKLYH